MYPLVTEKRLSWFVNDYDGRNTRGLGAYWGYLFGALDRRNFATLHYAPLDESLKSADSNISSTAESELKESSSSSDESITADDTVQSEIYTYMANLTEKTSGDQMPPNSMPNGSQMPPNSMPNGSQMPPNSMPNTVEPVRVSVIVPAIAQVPYEPKPVLTPGDQFLPTDWSEGNFFF